MLGECAQLKTKLLDMFTVPWNRREQIDEELEEWKMDPSIFVDTRGAKHVLKSVQENSCVTIVASFGVGKTATLHFVAFKLADEGYDILPIINPNDIIKFYNPNQKQLFVIDDFCGTHYLNPYGFNSWNSVIERITELIQNKLTKVIVACRIQVYQDKQFTLLHIFTTCVCNLLSEDLCLTQTEKQSIAELYLETEASEIIQYCDLYDCFPLLCKLYKDNPEFNASDFFRNPFAVYEVEIEKLEIEDIGKYCALALCVMFNNILFEQLFTQDIDEKIRTIIENTCEACRLSRGTSRLILLNKIESLEHTFIKKKYGFYRTIHDKIFDILVFYFGRKMIQFLIKNADSWVISKRLLLDKRDDEDQLITVVPLEYHYMYIERMIKDWSAGILSCVFHNINMKTPAFRQRFLNHLNTLDISFQQKIAQPYGFYDNSVMLQFCRFDFVPFIDWCITHGLDVNKCNSNNESPLCISAKKGHIGVVTDLLKKKADIHKCDFYGASPLFLACEMNHIDIVKILLENKANINKCTRKTSYSIMHYFDDESFDERKDSGESPLFIACQKNHKEIVQILIDNEADINKCRDDGLSPLSVACQKNHKEIVKLLLDNKADTNLQAADGTSPLFVACRENLIEIK
ncbi:uncharacterized protein LOC127707249 [Mytilus californianus]|uniref:uncharacterized protein LOC127707249 n=1 Tax=Mytilus californianus TaxID=6549 RepID=UPI0022450F57|nr:uncharacterized protein LOC127707249 [Mytilus californianus]